MTTLQKYIKKYQEFGWNLVPLYNYSKNPAPFRWKKYETEKMTQEDLDQWFNDPKLTGVGVVTGSISNITAIDEDSYKEGGKEFHLDSPLVSLTANGGKHFYFKHNPDISTTGFQKGVNLEIKSGGGFIVLPPSKVYKKDNQTMGEYGWLKADLKKIENLPTLDESDIKEYKSKRQFEKTNILELLDVELGEQHNSLRDFINQMLWKFEPNTWERLAYPAIRKEAKNYKPAHPDWRVEKLISDCSRWNLDKRKEKISPKSLSKIATLRLEEKELEKKFVSSGFPLLDEKTGGFIPGHLYTLTGETNVGKTSIASNFAVRVASQGKKVLYFALEPGNSIVDYLATARTTKQFSELTDSDVSYDDGNIHIYTQEDCQDVQELISLVSRLDRYDLVIVDHIGYFIKNTSNLYQEQSDVIKKLARLSRTKQSAIMMIAHLRKGVPDIPKLDDISGTGSFKQDSTDVLIAIRNKDSQDKMSIKYLAQGYILVAKTKRGENSAIPIEFTHKSAYIKAL